MSTRYLLCPPPHLVRDPDTNRFVAKNGRRGLLLQQLYPKLADMQCIRASAIPPHAAREPIAYVRHRDRHKYVERVGEFVEWASNKSIPYYRDDDTAELRHRMARRYGPEILTFIPAHYRISELGHGAYGYVYLLCNALSDECREVVKIQRKPPRMSRPLFLNNIQREVGMQRLFARHQLAPRIFDVTLFSHKQHEYAAIRMEKIDAILEHTFQIVRHGVHTKVFVNTLMNALDDMIEYMCKHRLIHADFHVGNIGYRTVLDPDAPGHYHWDLVMIDFGWASKGRSTFQCHAELEWIQFLRSLMIMRQQRQYRNGAFMTQLINTVYAHFRILYPQYTVKKTLDAVDHLFHTLHRGYREQHFFVVSM